MFFRFSMLQEGSVESIRRVHRFLNNRWERLCFDGIFPVDMHEPAIHHAQHSLECVSSTNMASKNARLQIHLTICGAYVWGCCASSTNAHKCVYALHQIRIDKNQIFYLLNLLMGDDHDWLLDPLQVGHHGF